MKVLLIQRKSVETATLHPPDIGGCEKRLKLSLSVLLFLPHLHFIFYFKVLLEAVIPAEHLDSTS